ncbi:MAG: hypothetical protein WDN06_13755 [Asticcacaulis sp.]
MMARAGVLRRIGRIDGQRGIVDRSPPPVGMLLWNVAARFEAGLALVPQVNRLLGVDGGRGHQGKQPGQQKMTHGILPL